MYAKRPEHAKVEEWSRNVGAGSTPAEALEFEPERGAPMGPDAQLIEVLNAWDSGMSDGAVAESFNKRGDKLIENFLEPRRRH